MSSSVPWPIAVVNAGGWLCRPNASGLLHQCSFTTDDKLAGWSQSMFALAFTILTLALAMLSCCLSGAARQGEVDFPSFRVPYCSCCCRCCCSTRSPSMRSRMRSLAVPLALLSTRVWLTAWSLPFTSVAHVVALVSLAVSLQILLAGAITSSNFGNDRAAAIQLVSRQRRVLLVCGSLYLVHFAIAAWNLVILTVSTYSSCDPAQFGHANCFGTRELYVTHGWLCLLLMPCVAWASFRLASSAGEFVNRANHLDARLSGSEPPLDGIPMADVLAVPAEEEEHHHHPPTPLQGKLLPSSDNDNAVANV